MVLALCIPHKRSLFSLAMQCDFGSVYTACGSPCPQTCRNIGDEPEAYCDSTTCVEGCFCPEGYVQQGKLRSVEKRAKGDNPLCRRLLSHKICCFLSHKAILYERDSFF